MTYLRCSIRRTGRSFFFVGRAELRLGKVVAPMSPLRGTGQRDWVALDPALHCLGPVPSGSKGQHALDLIPWPHPALRQGPLALTMLLASMPRPGSRSLQPPRASVPHDDNPYPCASPPRPARLCHGVTPDRCAAGRGSARYDDMPRGALAARQGRNAISLRHLDRLGAVAKR
jgi:hypothetical protein